MLLCSTILYCIVADYEGGVAVDYFVDTLTTVGTKLSAPHQVR